MQEDKSASKCSATSRAKIIRTQRETRKTWLSGRATNCHNFGPTCYLACRRQKKRWLHVMPIRFETFTILPYSLAYCIVL